MAGLVTNVLQAIQLIETARDRVRGKSKTIKNVAIQLDSIYQSLSLVRDEKALQTASVEQHCVVIIGIADELKAYFDRLRAGQQRTTVRQFFSALKSGDKDETELAGILERLDRARNELVLRISVAQVGLMGDMNQGFRVAYDLLMDTNRKCKKILGTELQLATKLEGRQPERSKRSCFSTCMGPWVANGLSQTGNWSLNTTSFRKWALPDHKRRPVDHLTWTSHSPTMLPSIKPA